MPTLIRPSVLEREFLDVAARGDLEQVRGYMRDNQVSPYWRGAATALAMQNKHEEVVDYLASLGGDGIDHPNLYDHLLEIY